MVIHGHKKLLLHFPIEDPQTSFSETFLFSTDFSSFEMASVSSMIRSGLSKLIQNGETPLTMLGQLKTLKHCAAFREDKTDLRIPAKWSAFRGVVKEEPKEYFEYEIDIKGESRDQQEMPSRNYLVSIGFQDRISTVEQEGSNLSIPKELGTDSAGEIVVSHSSENHQEKENTRPLLISPEKEKCADEN